MKIPKILITVSGGQVVSIATNTQDVSIVLIDEDNFKAGDLAVDKYTPEQIVINDCMYILYDESTPRDKEIRDELKRMKF